MVRSSFARLSVFAAAVGLAVFGFGTATPLQAKGGNNKGTNQATTAATAPLHTVIAELRHTHALLGQANHDYQGHRAKAHAEVGKAIHMLQTHPHHHHKHPALNTGARQRPHLAKIHEAQQLSDAQMQTAGQELQVILTQLAALQNHPLLAHPNINGAGANIQLAIAQIQQGLAVSPLNKK